MVRSGGAWERTSHGGAHGSAHGGNVTRRRTAFHTAQMVPHGAARRHTAAHTAACTRRTAPHGATRRRTAAHTAAGTRHIAPHGAIGTNITQGPA
eukprot:gene5439-biopygen6265